MTGRGVGRGIPRVNVPLPVVESLTITEEPSSGHGGSSIGSKQGVGRGTFGRFATAPVSQPVKAVAVREPSTGKHYGNFDPSRSTYRIPKRFRDRFKTQTRTPFENKIGTEGKEVRLTTNYFSMQDSRQRQLYQISHITLHFEPFPEQRIERASIIKCMKCLNNKDADVQYFYDGRGSLFMASSKRQIIFGNEKEISEPFRHRQHDPHPTGMVKLIFQKDIGDPSDLDDDNLNMTHGVLNLVFASILTDLKGTEPFIQIGDGFFLKDGAREIQGLTGLPFKLAIWPGYVPVLMQYDGGLLLNLDLCSRFFRTGTVLDAIEKIEPRNQVGSAEHCTTATAVLKGMIVLTMYNNMAYRIMEVTNQRTLTTSFTKRECKQNPDTGAFEERKEEFSIIRYLEKFYNVKIKSPNQPLLLCERASGDQRHLPKGVDPKTEWIPLVPELCWLSGLTDDLRTDFRNMNKILDAARKEPGRRGEILREFSVKLDQNTAARAVLKSWALKLGVDLEEVIGRELPIVELAQVQKSVPYERRDADWTRNLRGNRLDQPMGAKNFTMVYARQQEAQASALFDMLNKVGRPMGVVFANPFVIPVNSNEPSAFAEGISQARETSDIILCVLPDTKKERYDSIKIQTTTKSGQAVPSQCILAKNLDQKSTLSIVTKVALQMNAKMGGALWHIRDPAVKGDGVMVIGIVTGRAINMRGSKVAAFVATINSTYNLFASEAEFIPSGGISLEAYQKAIKELINAFRQENKDAVPQTVIIYRAMDRETDMFDVTDNEQGELEKAKAALKDAAPSAKLLFCVALKRCSSRFFAEGMVNPQPGTIIDQKVTIPGRNDFYLISHCGRKGTVMPTYYFIIEDETKIHFEAFQNFTFQMSHMYYNWSGTIKVPAVCQYALKMATLCGESTKAKPDPALRRKLWYL